MITKNYIKTLISGLMARITSHEISEDEMLDLLSEMKVAEPLVNNNNAIYTNNNGKIYIL